MFCVSNTLLSKGAPISPATAGSPFAAAGFGGRKVDFRAPPAHVTSAPGASELDELANSTTAPERSSKCLGDEEAKAEAAAGRLGIPAAGGEEGFADPLDHVGREARSVVADRHGDGGGVPAGGELDAAAGEIDGVFQQIPRP